MHPSYRPRLAALLLAQLALASSLHAQTAVSWDAGGGASTLTSNAANWNLDTLPAFGTGVQATMTTGGTASVDNEMIFGPTATGPTPALQFSGNFALGAGGGSVTLYGTNTGTTPVLRVNSGVSATNGVSIAAPLKVFVPATSAPRGSLLTIATNGNTTNTVLDITGGISLAAGSTGTAYELRYSNGGTAGTNFSGARIAGTISGLSVIANGNVGVWRGPLTIAGNQTLATTNVSISNSAGYGAPTATARLVLGETAADVQTWNNVTLNNTMTVAVGGTVSINAIAGTTNAGRIVGTGATGATLKINSGTLNSANITVGGATAEENTLDLVKQNTGTLTVTGTHPYTGTTTVNAGTLTLNGSLVSPLTLNTGATLAGEGSTTGALSFGAGTSILAFDPATQTGALSVASVSSSGTVIVSPSTPVTPGTDYTVLKLTGGTFSGSPSEIFALGSRGGSLSFTNGNTELTLTGGTAAAATLLWTGANVANPTFWDAAVTPNWSNSGSTDRYYAGDHVIFDDTATTTAVAIQGTSVSPASIIFNNSTKNYSVSGGLITGSASLTKSGSGTVTLATTGTSNFSGGLVLNDGVLECSTLGQLGAVTTAAQLDGGTLRFVGTAVTTGSLPFTVGAAGGTFDIASPANITVRIGGKISGGGNLVKSGTGVLALGNSSDVDPSNDFTGSFTVTGGTLDLRNPLALGDTATGTTVQNAILLLQNFGQTAGTKTYAAEPLTFSGPSFLTAYGQETKLYVNQITGPLTVTEGSTLAISTSRNSTGNVSPLLELTGTGITTTAGSTLSFGLRPAVLPANTADDNQTVSVAGAVTGPGSVVCQGTALSLFTLNAPGYSGDTSVLGGTLKLSAANPANESATVTLAETDAKLELAFSGSDTVSRLFLGTTQLAAGTYGATGSGATNIDDARFIGTGVLNVTTGPVTDLFAAWASGFLLTGENATRLADPDGDGLSNVLEYATGGDPTLAAPANITTGRSGEFLTLTYTRIADPALTYSVEGTNDLATTWLEVDDVLGANPATGSAAGSVTVVDTVSVATAGKRFLRLRVTY
jgi:autotransporter-associated beta strand protein